MTPIYIFLAMLGLWLAYKAVILFYHGIKAGITQANALEKQFGTNIGWAAQYTLGLSVPQDKDHDNAND